MTAQAACGSNAGPAGIIATSAAGMRTGETLPYPNLVSTDRSATGYRSLRAASTRRPSSWARELDPADNVRRLGRSLYLQFAGKDVDIPRATRADFRRAAPAARVSLYPDADHFLDQAAATDRTTRLDGRLSL